MKKKLSIILLCSVLTVSAAGCAGNTTGESGQSTASQTSSVQEDSGNTSSGESAETSGSGSSQEVTSDASKTDSSKTEESKSSASQASSQTSEKTDASKTESSNTQTSNVQISQISDEIDIEEGDPVDDDLNKELNEGLEGVESDGNDEKPVSSFIDALEMQIDIADRNLTSKKISFSSPAAYIIRSKDELDKFRKENLDKYSLNAVDEGETFSQRTVIFEDTFDSTSLIVIPVAYQSGSEPSVGELYTEGGKLVINVYAKQPSAESDAKYTCFLLSVDKGDVANVTPSVIRSDEETFLTEDEV